ncbi:hypothetical protein BDN70DRAFT_994905 [Pholiota conissans]|uniref:Uncharacterized protein n=1 Tax=Pholiota conissans TaxID=109636 RepID=A0A9P6CZC9_9AGAR|nr:hypothetical protein BDN70DRAFT_994905 [Pholiota conissans]
MAQRPRASILSLFDPLSLSPTSDKENNAGETSFFHTPGYPNKQTPAAQHTLRRRLIDIGDMTVDEPDMRHILEMEEELEELNKQITEDDDGETLTWRDMAKAATPKWSGRHATSLTTPKASPTPRTPLAEISFKDETTPMARKKSYRRQIVSGPSKLAQVDGTPERPNSVPSSPPFNASPDDASISVSPPSIQISGVDIDIHDIQTSTSLHNVLGASTYTLNLSTTTDTMLADTSLPLSASQLSSQSLSKSSLLPSTLLTPPLPHGQLSPGSHSKAPAENRMSVDLQSSFQLHLSSSDASFDLLNEKISFLSSKNEDDFFLNNLEIDDSFGDEDFATMHPKIEKDDPSTSSSNVVDPLPAQVEGDFPPLCAIYIGPPNSVSKSSKESPRPESLRVFVPKQMPTTLIDIESDSHANVNSLSNDNHESHDHARSTVVVQGPQSAKLPSPIRSPVVEKEFNVLSTPSSSYSFRNPLNPVPALKIVKRSKILSRRLSVAVNGPSVTVSTSNSTSNVSRRTSGVSSINSLPVKAPPTRARIAPSLPPSPAVNSGKKGSAPQLTATNPKKTAAPAFSNRSALSGDGPRRVLISEGPKFNSTSNARTAIGHSEPTKPPVAGNGPRRIMINSVVNVVEKPIAITKPAAPLHVSTGLKQPTKYNTVGASSIPKPVSRMAGSRLPAPTSDSSKSRFGVPTVAAGASSVRGLPGRRTT